MNIFFGGVSGEFDLVNKNELVLFQSIYKLFISGYQFAAKMEHKADAKNFVLDKHEELDVKSVGFVKQMRSDIKRILTKELASRGGRKLWEAYIGHTKKLNASIKSDDDKNVRAAKAGQISEAEIKSIKIKNFYKKRKLAEAARKGMGEGVVQYCLEESWSIGARKALDTEFALDLTNFGLMGHLGQVDKLTPNQKERKELVSEIDYLMLNTLGWNSNKIQELLDQMEQLKEEMDQIDEDYGDDDDDDVNDFLGGGYKNKRRKTLRKNNRKKKYRKRKNLSKMRKKTKRKSRRIKRRLTKRKSTKR